MMCRNFVFAVFLVCDVGDVINSYIMTSLTMLVLTGFTLPHITIDSHTVCRA